jgi:hypothetical protein
MSVGWRDVDRQRNAMLFDAQVNLDAVDLLAAIEAALKTARRRLAGSLTRQLSACGQRKGAVDDDSTWLGVVTASQPPGAAKPVKQAAPQPGPSGEQGEQRAERDIAELPDRAPLQKHRHQIARIALRSAAPVSAGFGPERVGFVPSVSMAASSASTSSTKASTSLKASQDAGDVVAVLTAVPI